jgi:hypothetical protein
MMGIGLDLTDTGVTTSTTTKHLLPGGLTVTVKNGRIESWHYPASDLHTKQALDGCARKRFRDHDARRTYALLLQKLCFDLRGNPKAKVPAAHEVDVREVLQAMTLDDMRRCEMKDRVLAFASLLPTTAVGA